MPTNVSFLRTAKKRMSHSFHAFFWHTRPSYTFSITKASLAWNCLYQHLMLLGDGGSLLNCRRNARWTETTDSCFTNCSTQNAFRSGVAIIALLRHRRREKRGCACAQNLNTCCFVPCVETYFWVRFEIRNCSFKLLQSFLYTLYIRIHNSLSVRFWVDVVCCTSYP